MLGLSYRPLFVMLCFAGLAPVRDDLLVAWGRRRFAAGECHNDRSKQENQSALAQQSSDERLAASEKAAASIKIGVRAVDGPDPFPLPGSMPSIKAPLRAGPALLPPMPRNTSLIEPTIPLGSAAKRWMFRSTPALSPGSKPRPPTGVYRD